MRQPGAETLRPFRARLFGESLCPGVAPFGSPGLRPSGTRGCALREPGVAPFGLTPGCTLARFQRANGFVCLISPGLRCAPPWATSGAPSRRIIYFQANTASGNQNSELRTQNSEQGETVFRARIIFSRAWGEKEN